MAYLKRIDQKPTPPPDMKPLEKRFDANAYEVNIEGGRADWSAINEVEVAKAARISSPAGWFVKKVMYGGDDRYHVGVFFDRGELVLTNVSLDVARYVVETVAFYATQPIRYTGIEGVAQTIES